MAAIMAALIGGAALSAGSGMMSASSSNRAAARARDFSDRDTLGTEGAFGGQLYGDQYNYVPTLRRLLGEAQQHNDPNAAAGYARQIADASRPTPTSILGRMGSTGENIIGQQGEDLTRFDTDTDRIERLFGGARDQMTGEAGRINSLAAGAEGIATQSGLGRERIIRRDADRRRTSGQQVARAGLASSGFTNTTALPAALSASDQAVGEAEDRALQDAQDARLNQLLAARSQRIATGRGLASDVYGANTDYGNVVAGRSTQRAGLRAGQLANEQQLRLMPILTELGVQQGGILNPHGQNVSGYYPGNSGGANALSSVGNTLTSAGGMMLGAQASRPRSPQNPYGSINGVPIEQWYGMQGPPSP